MEDTSKQEILSAIGTLSGRIDTLSGRFGSLSGRFDSMETDTMEAIHDLADQVQVLTDKTDLMQSDIGGMKSQMVTKSYLDDKLADLKGGLVNLVRKEDQKMNRFITILAEKQVMTAAETRDVLSFKVFP